MTVTGISDQSGNFEAELNIICNVPKSGFAVQIGTSGANYFEPIYSFSGISGFLFDSSGHFFGGYRSGIEFQIAIHSFENYYGYYLNNKLCTNNMYRSNIIGSGSGVVAFERYEQEGNTPNQLSARFYDHGPYYNFSPAGHPKLSFWFDANSGVSGASFPNLTNNQDVDGWFAIKNDGTDYRYDLSMAKVGGSQCRYKTNLFNGYNAISGRRFGYLSTAHTEGKHEEVTFTDLFIVGFAHSQQMEDPSWMFHGRAYNGDIDEWGIAYEQLDSLNFSAGNPTSGAWQLSNRKEGIYLEAYTGEYYNAVTIPTIDDGPFALFVSYKEPITETNALTALVGKSGGGANIECSGGLCEILGFKSPLTLSERAEFFEYAKNKWNIVR